MPEKLRAVDLASIANLLGHPFIVGMESLVSSAVSSFGRESETYLFDYLRRGGCTQSELTDISRAYRQSAASVGLQHPRAFGHELLKTLGQSVPASDSKVNADSFLRALSVQCREVLLTPLRSRLARTTAVGLYRQELRCLKFHWSHREFAHSTPPLRVDASGCSWVEGESRSATTGNSALCGLRVPATHLALTAHLWESFASLQELYVLSSTLAPSLLPQPMVAGRVEAGDLLLGFKRDSGAVPLTELLGPGLASQLLLSPVLLDSICDQLRGLLAALPFAALLLEAPRLEHFGVARGRLLLSFCAFSSAGSFEAVLDTTRHLLCSLLGTSRALSVPPSGSLTAHLLEDCALRLEIAQTGPVDVIAFGDSRAPHSAMYVRVLDASADEVSSDGGTVVIRASQDSHTSRRTLRLEVVLSGDCRVAIAVEVFPAPPRLGSMAAIDLLNTLATIERGGLDTAHLLSVTALRTPPTRAAEPHLVALEWDKALSVAVT